ncbi:unnamed protein product [Cylicostephanus goldi]|uniref:Uncharacterized protein n=1 Tax=Cylicostephanus goldi TaxID=71465 RepID=A0A3P7NPJ6_CYLGO|nr:unnamed protein product [Cylicostephanus goldi]
MLACLITILPVVATAARFDCETKLIDLLNWRNRVTEQLRVVVELKTNHHSELNYDCELERKVKTGGTSNRVLLVTFKNIKDIAANAGREMENLLNNSMLKVSKFQLGRW